MADSNGVLIFSNELGKFRETRLMKIHMIPLVRSDNICKNQKASWEISLRLSGNLFVLTFTEQQAALKSLLFMSNIVLDDCTPLVVRECQLMR